MEKLMLLLTSDEQEVFIWNVIRKFLPGIPRDRVAEIVRKYLEALNSK